MPCQLYSDGNFPGIHCPRSHKKWSNFKAHKNVRNGETKLPHFGGGFFSGNFPHFLTNLGKFKLFSITISYILCTLVW